VGGGYGRGVSRPRLSKKKTRDDGGRPFLRTSRFDRRTAKQKSKQPQKQEEVENFRKNNRGKRERREATRCHKAKEVIVSKGREKWPMQRISKKKKKRCRSTFRKGPLGGRDGPWGFMSKRSAGAREEVGESSNNGAEDQKQTKGMLLKKRRISG